MTRRARRNGAGRSTRNRPFAEFPCGRRTGAFKGNSGDSVHRPPGVGLRPAEDRLLLVGEASLFHFENI